MSLSTEKKKTVIDAYGAKGGDTGSPEVQVALITERINELTAHMKTHQKDNRSQRALVELVSTRQRHLTYLKRTSLARYHGLVEKLGLRK
jgi:small subunit ribosomal protein S15